MSPFKSTELSFMCEKPDLYRNVHSSFQAISNLTKVTKVTLKAAAERLTMHVIA